MTATVHNLTARLNPTATPPAAPDGEWTERELRAWWLGYAAGHADRDRQYEQQDAQVMAAVQRFLDSRQPAPRPRLEVVS